MESKKLKYKSDIDSFVEFQVHWAKRSDISKAYLKKIRVWLFIIMLLLPTVIVFLQGGLSPETELSDCNRCLVFALVAVSIIFAIAVVLLGEVVQYLQLNYFYRNTTKKKLKDSADNNAINEEVEMSFDSEKLYLNAQTSSSSILLEKVLKVEFFEKYVFIYISDIQAYPIDRELVLEGDIDDFIEELKKTNPKIKIKQF